MAKRRRIPVVAPDPVRTLHGSFPRDTLDLHGMHARSAEGEVRRFLEQWTAIEPGAVVRVITGKGNNSEGPPVLRGRVRELLTGGLAPLVDDFVLEMGGGSYLVRLRGARR
jgi:DNA-nicking Smr family endonuclease